MSSHTFLDPQRPQIIEPTEVEKGTSGVSAARVKISGEERYK